MFRLRRSASALLVLTSVLALSSCAALDQMTAALTNLQRLKFRLAAVRDFRLMGIDIGGKAALGDFNALDAVKIAQAYRSRELPVEFVLDVLAVNPNDGTGGSRRSTSTLTGLECRLLVDGKPTVTGDIDRPFEIPGTGQESIVPLRLSLDLLEFFGDRRYEDLIGLALALGGRDRTATKIALDARPTVSTPFGPIAYPDRITIVSTEFR
ncbi:MAG TPA: hypothetical protein ENO03_05240 [Candidatus Aminicenantes bacterium]|nr:hypothetical protein [Candidatus Aminicenantes bacterium]HDT13746.1 hypothetical protein [Candidatus Aminicenantes bacterium]